MKLDITSVLAGRKKNLQFSYEIAANEERIPLPPEGVTPTSGIAVNGKISDSGSCFSLSVTASMEYDALCDRCADKIHDRVEITLERIIAGAGVISNVDGDEYVIEENGNIDIDLDLIEEIMLSFPSQLLCRSDCAGICAKCGCNFNYESCDCAEQKEIDPRWAVLQKLLESKD